MNSYNEDMELLKSTLIKAADIAMHYFKKPVKQWMKTDNSPVSEADIKVNEYLQKTLLEQRPYYGWISEESDDNSLLNKKSINFIVDPIDGTRGFLIHDLYWCIGIAIEQNNEIVASAIICPAIGEFYYGAKNCGAYFNGQPFTSIEHVKSGKESLVLALPRKLLNNIKDRELNNLTLYPYISSLLYKIILCARGIIDVVIIYPSCKVWDIAAANLFLQYTKGILVDYNETTIVYSRLGGGYEHYLFACKNNSYYKTICLEIENIIR